MSRGRADREPRARARPRSGPGPRAGGCAGCGLRRRRLAGVRRRRRPPRRAAARRRRARRASRTRAGAPRGPRAAARASRAPSRRSSTGSSARAPSIASRTWSRSRSPCRRLEAEPAAGEVDQRDDASATIMSAGVMRRAAPPGGAKLRLAAARRSGSLMLVPPRNRWRAYRAPAPTSSASRRRPRSSRAGAGRRWAAGRLELEPSCARPGALQASRRSAISFDGVLLAAAKSIIRPSSRSGSRATCSPRSDIRAGSLVLLARRRSRARPARRRRRSAGQGVGLAGGRLGVADADLDRAGQEVRPHRPPTW